jgi:hypothetical protein
MRAKDISLSGITRRLTDAIKHYEDQEFPLELCYQQAMEHPLFTITIQKKDSNEFVDALGQKWKRVPDEDEEDEEE